METYEPAIIDCIEQFYAAPLSDQVEITRRLSVLVFEPIGGIWQDGEILAFGERAGGGLQEQGKELFGKLFEIE